MHVGKLSGRAALAANLHELGYDLEPEPLNRAFDMAKLLLSKKRELEELDLRYIAETALTAPDWLATSTTRAEVSAP